MATEQAIREQTRKTLSEANLDGTSARTIKSLVGQALEIPKEELRGFHPLIEDEIRKFLELQAHEDLPATPASMTPHAEERDNPDSDGRPAKQRKLNDPEPGPGEYPISDLRTVVVRDFKGKQLVDIREFYEKDGELKPGAKGLALTPEQWHVLAASLTELNKAVEEDSIGHTVNLASNRRVTVTSFKGSTNVDLREYYEKNGDLAPGKKGIALTVEQWHSLCSHAEKITAAVGPAASNDAKSGDTPSKQTPSTGASGSGEYIDLGKMRRASVSEFKGKKLLNIREYYEKNGEARPGKKGISLSKDQAEKLLHSKDELLDGVVQQEELSVPLGTKRYAKVNKFKGSFLLDIREYYEKDGEEKPGAKGLSLTPDQWNTLAPRLSDLVSQL